MEGIDVPRARTVTSCMCFVTPEASSGMLIVIIIPRQKHRPINMVTITDHGTIHEIELIHTETRIHIQDLDDDLDLGHIQDHPVE